MEEEMTLRKGSRVQVTYKGRKVEALVLANEPEKKLNQFGEVMVCRIPVALELEVWGCSICGTPTRVPIWRPRPKRCNNRETCGRLFH